MPAGHWNCLSVCTGAGKTSVINTIFRLMELDEGSISVDGVNIAKLGLAQLRNAMAIIPQVIFRAATGKAKPCACEL